MSVNSIFLFSSGLITPFGKGCRVGFLLIVQRYGLHIKNLVKTKNNFDYRFLSLNLQFKPKTRTMTNEEKDDKVVCTICNTEEDEEFTYGYIGMIPVNFCVWCYSGIIDMAQQLNTCDCQKDE